MDPISRKIYPFLNIERQGGGVHPPPPKLPEYNVEDEAPKYDPERVLKGWAVDKGDEPWTLIGTQPKSDDQRDWRGVKRSEVIEHPMPGPHTYGRYEYPHYYWFDTPDYADPFKKLGFAAKYFTHGAILLSSAYGLLNGYRITPKDLPIVATKVFIPAWMAGMSAALTVVTVANLRGKKDDAWNYFAGSLVAGSIIGRRSYMSHVRSYLWIIPLGYVLKYVHEDRVHQYSFDPRTFANPRNLYKGWDHGGNAAHGFFSGDLRFTSSVVTPEPGRDFRRTF